MCLRWIINLNVLQHIPKDGSISYTDLATSAGVPEQQLKSVVRMAAANGLLQETNLATVAHSPTSALIASDESFLNWARFLTNYSVPSAYHFADATQKWGSTEEKNQTAFNIAMNVDVPFFGYLKANAQMNNMFSSYMRNVASSEATSFKHLLAGFDWGSLAPGATVVDVGGSGGHGSRAIAKEFPNLQFIVQDLPDTIENAKKTINGEAAKFEDQVRFMPHDFFTPQPVTDADIYLLRMIIHDWPDEPATTILGHLRDALKKPGSRIVIMDTILPQPGSVSLLQERTLRVRDLTMMQVFNSKEREYDTWKELLAKVGLTIINVRQPEGSNMGLLEVGLADLANPVVISQAPRVPDAVNGSQQRPSSINGNAAVSSGQVNGHHVSSEQVLQNGTQARTLQAQGHSEEALPVLIMGAGISGLCLAQNLHRNSVPFLVFERDPNDDYRPQGYRLKLEADAAAALEESLSPELYQAFEASCAVSSIGETDFDPVSGACIKSRAGGGLAGNQGLRATYTVDRSVFRRVLMSDIRDKIQFGREFASYETNEEQGHVLVTFKDGSTAKGRFLVGADGTRSAIRKQLAPHHEFLDTGAVCIYGKTNMTPELLERYPARALRWMTVCADMAPLIQSILIGDSPLTLLSEPIRFSAESRAKSATPLPGDYVYWVLIGRKELFTDLSNLSEHATTAPSTSNGGSSSSSSSSLPLHTAPDKAFNETAAQASAAQSLALTGEWHPSLRSLFELQDVRQASTMRVVSSPPRVPTWQASAYVTLVGDAVHAMSPCGGVGANTALRDAAELAKLFTKDLSRDDAGLSIDAHARGDGGDHVARVAAFDEGVRKRAFGAVMRSYVGSKAMFSQAPFEELAVVSD